jgi:hypothetical protein
MKKLILGMLGVGVAATVAFAAVTNWYPTNQATVAWNPVTALSDGSPLPAGSVIKYEVFTASPDHQNVTSKGVVTVTSTVLSFQAEGRYIVGVRAIREFTDPADPQTVVTEYSETVWSDDPAYVGAEGTFGISYIFKPANPTGLRRQ